MNRTQRVSTSIVAALAPSAAVASDFGSTLVSIGVPAIIFSFVLAVVWGAYFLGWRETKEKQETLRLAIEKGVAIPPELVAGAKGRHDPEKDLRSGVRLLFIGVGVGVLLFFVAPYRNVWAVGAMLVIFGLGQIVASRVGPRSAPPSGPDVPSGPAA